jgi:signal transduction histidine kinase
MDRRLAQIIRTIVNSRAKLDVLYYFHRNPYACESMAGLAQRLHRAAEDLEGALQELTRQGLLLARSTREGGSELVFSPDPFGAPTDDVRALLEAYEGPERRDILQAVSAEDEQTRVRDVAQRRALDDLRTRFVSMVTHELRTPVTVMKSVLSALCATGAITDSRALSLLSSAGRQAERLSSIVENLLVLSGLQTGRRLELYLSPVDLPRLVEEVCARFKTEESQPNLRVHLDDAPAAAVADEYLLGQLLEELVDNAIKFSPREAPVDITVSQDEDQALFVIDDEGAGVSAHQQERVFDPFFQGQEDSARLTGGMGLGLFMARRIAQTHGGNIWLEPKPPPGMRVCFTIPLAGPPGWDGGEAE